MKRSLQYVVGAGALGALLLVDAVPVQAQMIEEILVTARKRTESAQDVPVVIQAFDAAAINRYAASNLEEISELASQVVINPGSSGNGGSVIIRGVGAPTLDPGIENSVTINIDGVQIDRGHVVRQAFFDMGSVQVLKGPQALFYGKNSPAGVIALEAARPSYTESETRFQLGYEIEAREIMGEAVVSRPITENFAARLAYRGTGMKGFLKNDAQPIASPFPTAPFDFPGAANSRVGGDEGHAARLTLLWAPTDQVEATLRVLGTRYRTDNFGTLENVSCSQERPITTDLATGNIVQDPFGNCRVDGRVSHGSNPPEVAADWPGAGNGDPSGKYDSWLASLNVEAEFDNFTLTSVTGFYYYDYFRFDNFDGTVFWQLGGMQLEEHTSFSQEIRAHTRLDGPVNFMGGVFFETFGRDSDNRGRIAPLPPVPGVHPFTNNWEGLSRVDTDTWSVFGQVTWDITDEIELAGGTRWTHDERDAIQGNTTAHPAFDGTVLRSPSAGPLISDFKDKNFSSEVTLSWRPRNNLTLFAAYREGYKAGGFSTNTVLTPIATDQSVVFEPEEADGFEVGVKSILLDGRMRLNGAIYTYDFKNLQVSAFDPATTSFNIINAASSTSEGVEVDAEYLVNENLTLRGQIGYNIGEFDRFPTAPCWAGQTAAEGCVGGVQDLSGHRRPQAPKWNTSFGFDYQQPIHGTGWSMSLASDAVFVDKYSTQTSDNPFSHQGSVWRINARLSLFSDDDRWDVSLIGRNLLNERYISGTSDKPGGVRGDVFGQTIRPRQIMFQTTYRL